MSEYTKISREDLEDMLEEATDELETLRQQLAEAVEALKVIANFGNYATDGYIKTSDVITHVSDYAADVLKKVTPVE